MRVRWCRPCWPWRCCPCCPLRCRRCHGLGVGRGRRRGRLHVRSGRTGFLGPRAGSPRSGRTGVVAGWWKELRQGRPLPWHLAARRPRLGPRRHGPRAHLPRGCADRRVDRVGDAGWCRWRSSCSSAMRASRPTWRGGALGRASRPGCSGRPGWAPDAGLSTAVVYGVLVLVVSQPGAAVILAGQVRRQRREPVGRTEAAGRASAAGLLRGIPPAPSVVSGEVAHG